MGVGGTSVEGPLSGRTVVVTAERRQDELVRLLERRGATTVTVQMLRTVPLGEDPELVAATRRCVAEPVDVFVAMTGVGFRGWLDVATADGVHGELVKRLGRSRILARGPKAAGAIRAAGLREDWSAPEETSAEILVELTGGAPAESLVGKRVAVQLHGERMPDFVGALSAAGADVIEVPVYRWLPPPDAEAVAELVRRIVSGSVDAVTFTSAPAAANLVRAAADLGLADRLRDAFSTKVMAACVGPVTAAPLVSVGISTMRPERARNKALVDAIVAAYQPAGPADGSEAGGSEMGMGE